MEIRYLPHIKRISLNKETKRKKMVAFINGVAQECRIKNKHLILNEKKLGYEIDEHDKILIP